MPGVAVLALAALTLLSCAPPAALAAPDRVTPAVATDPVFPGGQAPQAEPALADLGLSANSGAASDPVAAGAFMLPVPFRTQKDGDRFQGSNCGPASLAMVLAAYGIEQSNGDLRFRSHTYQGTVGMRTGTALQFVARAGSDFGLDPQSLYDTSSGGFRRWVIDDVRAEVEQGRPVVPLVKFRLMPGHESSTVRFDHYVVIYGMDGEDFLYNDPIYASDAEGAGRRISPRQLDAAMAAAIVPRQAVAFGPGDAATLVPIGLGQA